jgi:hypothetical protein
MAGADSSALSMRLFTSRQNLKQGLCSIFFTVSI